jgi:hypothetical protein
VVTRLKHRETGVVLVHLIKQRELLFSAIFKNAVPITDAPIRYRVPTLEMALALKFAPMVSLNRSDDKKMYDAGDFIRMVRANPTLNQTKLSELGELVYPGGGREIIEFVRRVNAGEKLNL